MCHIFRVSVFISIFFSIVFSQGLDIDLDIDLDDEEFCDYRSFDIGIDGIGLSFGNSEYFNGLRFNT